MASTTQSGENVDMAPSTQSTADNKSLELLPLAEVDLGDRLQDLTVGSSSEIVSTPRTFALPVGWSLESRTPEHFPNFPKLPFELRSMIWILHHDESNEIVINFKKTVWRAENPGLKINNVNTKGTAFKRMWWNRTYGYTPEEYATGLVICKESATAYKIAKPCIFQWRIRGAKVYFNQHRDILLFNAEHCYLTYLYAQAIRPPGGFAGGYQGLQNVKRALFKSNDLIFDIDRVIEKYKASCNRAEEGRDEAVKQDPNYRRWIQEAQDYEISQIKKSAGNAQDFISKLADILDKNGIQIWQEGEDNEVFLAEL